jgi:hypothetical protein
MKIKPLTSSQIRAARALLRWTADDLSRASALGINTIRRAELAENETSMTAANDLSAAAHWRQPALSSLKRTAAGGRACGCESASGQRHPKGEPLFSRAVAFLRFECKGDIATTVLRDTSCSEVPKEMLMPAEGSGRLQ